MYLGIGLGITRLSGVLGFNPASPFANGEEGAWYDPSDLTTLYQDAAGTTPVTAAGQPVGLMLDKSKGLTLESELVTGDSSDFTSSLGSWTYYTGATATASGGAFTISAQGTYVINSLLTIGKTYRVSFDWTRTADTIGLFVGDRAQASQIRIPTGNGLLSGTYAGYIQCSIAAAAIGMYSGGGLATIDNISILELPGNHATQSTSTARPTLQTSGGLYYLDFDGVDDYMSLPSITTSQPFGLFVAAENQTSAIVGVISGGVGGYLGVRYTTNAYWGTFDGSNRLFALTSVGSPDIVALTQDSGISYPRINGVDSSSYAAGLTSQTWVTFGAFTSGSSRFDGRVYGSVIIEKSLSPAEVQSTESYLATKSGVTLP